MKRDMNNGELDHTVCEACNELCLTCSGRVGD